MAKDSHYLEQIRFQRGGKFLHSILRVDHRFQCFIVEDRYRKPDEKVKGTTAIPEGMYELKLRKYETPLTKYYRKKYPWFKYFIEITNVPNFQNIYYHIGNHAGDSEGCPALGETVDSQRDNGWVGRSTPAMEKFYAKVVPWLEAGHEVHVNIINIIPEGEI